MEFIDFGELSNEKNITLSYETLNFGHSSPTLEQSHTFSSDGRSSLSSTESIELLLNHQDSIEDKVTCSFSTPHHSEEELTTSKEHEPTNHSFGSSQSSSSNLSNSNHTSNSSSAEVESKSVVVQETSIDEEDLSYLINQAKTSGRLSLSNWSIESIPSEIFQIGPTLTQLDISANNLKALPTALNSLVNLKKLSINHNNISVLSSSLFCLTNLTSLFINNNRIRFLPPQIKNLVKLKTLDISHNFLTEIPSQIGDLTNLTELRARSNKLDCLPKEIAIMPSLKVVSFSGNPLSFPPLHITQQGLTCIINFLVDPNNIYKPKPASSPKKRKFSIDSPIPLHAFIRNKKIRASHLPHTIAEDNSTKVNFAQTSVNNTTNYNNTDNSVNNTNTQQDNSNPIISSTLSPLFSISSPSPSSFLPPSSIPPSIFSSSPFQIRTNNNNNNNNNNNSQNLTSFCQIHPSELTMKKIIGRGSYGEVWFGTWRNTNCAIKKLYNENMTDKMREKLKEEISLLCKLRHPNIVLFMGACLTEHNSLIVMEYLSRGNLASILCNKHVPLPYSLKLQMLKDAACGLDHLHSLNIIHRDIKTENLLVDENWTVKIADFGLAKTIRIFARTNCGTVGYCAPEVLRNVPYTLKADVYSFGVILWEVFTRTIPYKEQNSSSVIRSIDNGETLPIPSDCPRALAQLMISCWQPEPFNRPSMELIISLLDSLYSEIDFSEE